MQQAILEQKPDEKPTFFHGLALWAQRNRLFLYCLFVSFFVLAICSKSSFLYPFNDWVDANCYFTVGKSMMHGKVVYKDLYEQKGLYLYIFHAISYLISNTSFFGVWLFEVAAGALYLYYAAKIIDMYLPHNLSYVLLPILAVLTFAQASFAEGDSAEEFCLPLLMAGLYYLLKFFRGDDLSKKELIINGALAGGVLWIKYTMLGFFAGWMLGVFVGFLLRKQVKKAFLACAYFLLGMGIATLPVFLYFLINGALYDLYYMYFYINIAVYGKVTSSIAVILNTMVTNFGAALNNNPIMLYGGLVFIAGFLCTNKIQRGVWPKISLALIAVLLIMGVYGGGKKYPYYFLIFYVFLVLALVAVGKLLVYFAKRGDGESADPVVSEKFKRSVIVMAMLAFMFSSTGAYLCSPNKNFMAVQQSQLAQFRFAKIINASDNPTLLNYGFLDGGFYTASGVVPSTKYFCKINVVDPAMMQAQNAIIRNKGVKFVVIRLNSGEKSANVAYLANNYRLVDSVSQIFENKRYTYLLYQAK